MKRLRKVLIAVVPLVLLTSWMNRAVANPPAHDRLSGAKVVAVGFSETVGTTEATTDADDRALTRSCGPIGPEVADASVWYSFTPAVAGPVRVDVSASSYSAGVMVGTRGAGQWTAHVCHPRAATFLAEAGTTYHLLAFDDQNDGAGEGGMLVFSLAAAPPGPDNDTVSGAPPVPLGFHGQLDTGQATSDADDIAVNGTCPNPAGATDASVWYRFTPDTTGDVTVDVSASSYTAGVFVVEGSPGDGRAVVCGPQVVTFPARAGAMYSVVTFDDQGDGGGNGGMLDISFGPGEPGDGPGRCGPPAPRPA